MYAVRRAALRAPLLARSSRCLSTALKRPAGLARHDLRWQQPGGSRSLWGFSKPAPPPPAANSSSPDAVPLANDADAPLVEATAVPIPIEPPAASAPALDAASSTPLPDTVVASDALPVDLIASIPPPLNYGDLAALGLTSWNPAGLSRWAMELLNVSTGMPWFWTIVGATVLTRVMLFPFSVKQLQSTAALAPHTDEINKIRELMAAAQAKRDTLAMQHAALRQKMVYEKANVSMPGMILSPIVQLPVTLGMFFGVKKLCEFPVEQLKYSGVSFLQDLTVADPTYVLPVLVTVLMNVQISVTMRDLVGQTPQMAHIMNGLRVLTTASIFIMANFTSGLLVYLCTSIIGMTAQSLILRQPAVRRMLRIPQVPPNQSTKAPSMMDSARYARKWWQDKVAEARRGA